MNFTFSMPVSWAWHNALFAEAENERRQLWLCLQLRGFLESKFTSLVDFNFYLSFYNNFLPKMLEESIDASPNNLNSSILRKREHRKAKRRRLQLDLSNNQQSNPPDDQKLLQMYCDDSDQQEPVTLVAQRNTFKRFQAENLLANADRFYVVRETKKVPELTQLTQDFWTCERLLEVNTDSSMTPQDKPSDTTFLSCQSDLDSTNVNLDTAWILEGFEDDMALQPDNCQANQSDEIELFDQTLVPNEWDNTMRETRVDWEENFVTRESGAHVKRKTIVEAILEDFCTSPEDSTDRECEELDLENVMPFFRFRRKRIRTYERCWRQSVKNVKNVPTKYKHDDDCLSDGSDTSSELSVQEDKSQVIPTVEPLDPLNASSKIRSNLLNLSAFFTQNLVDDDEEKEENCATKCMTATEDADDKDRISVHVSGYEAIKKLIEEILTLRAKYTISYGLLAANSNEDFHGFSLTEELAVCGDECVAEPQSRNLVCRSAPTLMDSSHNDIDNLSIINKKTDASDDHSANQQLSFDEDSWHHDSDFFANFQTQAVLRASSTDIHKTRRKSDSTLQLSTPKGKSKQLEEKNTINEHDKSTSNKPEFLKLTTSNKQQDSVDDVRPTVSTALKPVQSTCKTENKTVESQISIDDILKLSENAKNVDLRSPAKKHDTSKVLDNDFDCMLLSEWPLEENQPDKNNEMDKITYSGNQQARKKLKMEPIELVSSGTSNFVEGEFKMPQPLESKTNCCNEFMAFEGFKTASLKEINISEQARKRVDDLFACLPELPVEKPKSSALSVLKIENLASQAPQSDTKSCAKGLATFFTSFQADSNKAINISEVARKRIESMFGQLPELPDDTAVKPLSSIHTQKLNKSGKEIIFTGFTTASRKAITVSEEAHKMISIFDELPEITAKKKEKAFRPITKTEDASNQVDKNQKSKEAATFFTGLETASRKVINISEEACKKADILFAQLPELPSKELKKEPLKSINTFNKVEKKTEQICKKFPDQQLDNFEDLINMPLSEWMPNCESPQSKQIVSVNIEPDISKKRKLLSISSEQPTKMLCKSHKLDENANGTPVNSFRNNQIRRSLSLASNTKTNGRVNLLSLTKRRRESLRMENKVQQNVTTDSADTPVKMLAVPKNTTPYTPQANEFYAQLPAAASTPQQVSVAQTSFKLSKHSMDNLDLDFKRINWENADDSHNTTPTRNNNSILNKSLKPQPSPQERIDNLSSCGDPPPLLQLVENKNRSRHLGLSRGRRFRIITSTEKK